MYMEYGILNVRQEHNVVAIANDFKSNKEHPLFCNTGKLEQGHVTEHLPHERAFCCLKSEL